jgi:hypothetical protein
MIHVEISFAGRTKLTTVTSRGISFHEPTTKNGKALPGNSQTEIQVPKDFALLQDLSVSMSRVASIKTGENIETNLIDSHGSTMVYANCPTHIEDTRRAFSISHLDPSNNLHMTPD